MPTKPRTPRVVSSLSFAVAAIVLLGGPSCTKVTKPSSDSTPPTITWDVYSFTSGQHTAFGNAGGQFATSAGESVRVTCKAEDPGGVQQITLGGVGSYGCKQGSIGQTANLSQATDVQNLSPDANNQVLTSIFLLRTVEPDGWTCQAGFTFTGGSLQLHCTATNYYAGTTSSSLTISR